VARAPATVRAPRAAVAAPVATVRRLRVAK
jgi:hypothetical protein